MMARDGQHVGVLLIALDDIGAIGDALISGRIARKWTQANLAHALGIPPQQVQGHEATRYRQASLARLAGIAAVLGVRLEGTAVLATPPPGGAAPPA
jgi:transcriptional regulator with XRE-family HTH domain